MDESPELHGRMDQRGSLAGILIVLALITAAVVTISLDELISLRTPMVNLNAALPGSGGLQVGAPVWIAGHEVGVVTAVTLVPPDHPGDSRIIAIARIPRANLALLRADSRAKVVSARLMGDPVLELTPGSAPMPPLGLGDTIPAEATPRRAAEAMASARRVLLQVDTLMSQLRDVGELYQARRPMIDEVMRSVDLASIELDRTATAVAEGPLAGAMRDARLGERFERVRASLALLQQGLGRYTSGPLGDRITSLRARADSLQGDIARLDSLASDPSAGFIGRFRADSAIAVEAGRTGAQMDSLVDEVMSNPFMFF